MMRWAARALAARRSSPSWPSAPDRRGPGGRGRPLHGQPQPSSRERPFRGITLVTVGDRVVCTGFVVGPAQGRDRRALPDPRRRRRRLQVPQGPARQRAHLPRLQLGSYGGSDLPHLRCLQGLGALQVHQAQLVRPCSSAAAPTTTRCSPPAGLLVPARTRSCACGRTEAFDGKLDSGPEGQARRLSGRPTLLGHERAQPVAHARVASGRSGPTRGCCDVPASWPRA